jgi:hypothetical protein
MKKTTRLAFGAFAIVSLFIISSCNSSKHESDTADNNNMNTTTESDSTNMNNMNNNNMGTDSTRVVE